MNRMVVQHRDGDLYEVQYVVHSKAGIDFDDVFAVHRLSAYDGMPIGSLTWIAKRDIVGHIPDNVPVRDM